jgi:hypothetical protein
VVAGKKGEARSEWKYRIRQLTRRIATLPNQSQVPKSTMTLNDLEFAYAPVRNQVRDLREYL